MNHKISKYVVSICAGLFMVAISPELTFASMNAGVSAMISSCLQQSEGLIVATSDVLISRMAAEETQEEEKEEDQTQESLYGYKNLGLANVDTYLNVREDADEDSELVGKMPKGAGCEVYEEKDGWYHIKSGKVDGYVTSEYLLTGEAAIEKSEKFAKTVATVNTTTLFVRMEPNTDCKILTMVPIEEELTVLEEVDGGAWYEIELDDESGYVSGDYVDISMKLPKAMTMSEVKYGQGVSDVRVSLVQYALQFVGRPYVWGGTSLTNGVDCSGFTMQVYAKFGVYLPHSSRAQPNSGRTISASEAQPGDLFFYGSGGRINHVAIYMGGGRVVHASNRRDGIKISNAYYRTPLKVVSYL
ncbi:MAG: NlpC/P60 family protein [bacterium]|nr:NlpC/P60 family protein [bacterium]